MKELRTISDEALLTATKRLAREEREILAEILRHLQEVERRRLFCDHGSLFGYAVNELKYTEDQAWRRLAAMRLFREVPEIEAQVVRGDLGLTHIGIASEIFASEKKKGRTFSRDRKREVFAAMAGLPTRKAKRVALEFAEELPTQPDQVRPLTGGRNLVKIEVHDDTLAKMEKVKGRLAHVSPNMSFDAVINKTCDIALEHLDPAREPKRNVKTSGRAGVRRAVFKRDQRCVNCGSDFALEIDHIHPKGMGGGDSIDNLRVLCRTCNQRAAIETYGQDKMEPHLSPAAPRDASHDGVAM